MGHRARRCWHHTRHDVPVKGCRIITPEQFEAIDAALPDHQSRLLVEMPSSTSRRVMPMLTYCDPASL